MPIYNISPVTQDYLDYIVVNNYFKSLPKWKLELWGYESRPPKKVTLPSTDTTNSLESLPPARNWKTERLKQLGLL